MKVYIITRAWCDDTWVVGVFSKEKKAMKFKEEYEKISDDDYFCCEEFELDKETFEK
jgi:hypothetical protein